MANAHAQSLFLAVEPVTPARVIHFLYAESFSMDEKEAEARPVMGTIFLVYIYIHDSQLNRPESVSLASLARQLPTTKRVFA